MTYEMKSPYFFAGQDLSNEPDSKDFTKLLCEKAGIKTNEVSAPVWNNSHSQYVIAKLKVTGANAKKVVNAIKAWFWDPKNQMLHFTPLK